MGLSEKTINHRDFGRITIVKSARARRISISMRPFEPLKLTLPIYVSSQRAEDFLIQKEKWILRNLEKISKLEDKYTIFTDETEFHTLEHRLNFIRYREQIARVSVRDNKILVSIPEQAEIKDPDIQELIRRGIESAWRKEARKYLPLRLDELSRKHGLYYNKVVIRNNKTRWGSCSHKNNINLSLHLLRLPPHLIDYILLHELVHTVHKNHSKKFWTALERVSPGARLMDRELKEYRMDIY